jgi:uncharacterized membrane protein YkvA (DUF1232 family)
VDATTANALADVSIQLLGLITDETPESDRRLIQAAIRYFVLEEDAVGDLVSQAGFDDDRTVMNAVLRALGLEHLVIPTG